MILQNSSILDARRALRVSLRHPKKISGDIQASLLDLSNRGLSFSMEATADILNKTLNIEVEILSEVLKFTVCPIWAKPINGSSDTLFGATILDSSSVALSHIVKTMIYEQFHTITKKLKSIGKQKDIMKFCKSVARYALVLAELDQRLEKNEISDEAAYQKLKESTDQIVLEGEKLKHVLNDKLVISKIKEEFRKIVSPWAYKSLVVKHSYDKPRGYPGDYETLEIIYNKQTITEGNKLGRLFDQYFLNNPYADAVRNRKEYIKGLLLKQLSSDKSNISILDLACGSSREIREVFLSDPALFRNKTIKITCLDWEDDALSFSAREMRGCPNNVKIEWLKEDILAYAKSKSFFENRGKFDMIYSIGLADYLPDRVNKRIIQTSFNGLAQDGVLVFAHKNKEIIFSHLPPEWFCDWEFIPRSEAETMELFYSLKLKDAKFKVDWDSTKDVFFINAINREPVTLPRSISPSRDMSPPDRIAAF